MDYKNYTIQITQSGLIARDSKGKYIRLFATEAEAIKWINEHN